MSRPIKVHTSELSPKASRTPRESKLKLGLVPAGTECPFRGHCGIAQAGQCKHLGKDHTCDFSCALARGFDLIQEYNTEVGPIV